MQTEDHTRFSENCKNSFAKQKQVFCRVQFIPGFYFKESKLTKLGLQNCNITSGDNVKKYIFKKPGSFDVANDTLWQVLYEINSYHKGTFF